MRKLSSMGRVTKGIFNKKDDALRKEGREKEMERRSERRKPWQVISQKIFVINDFAYLLLCLKTFLLASEIPASRALVLKPKPAFSDF